MKKRNTGENPFRLSQKEQKLLLDLWAGSGVIVPGTSETTRKALKRLERRGYVVHASRTYSTGLAPGADGYLIEEKGARWVRGQVRNPGSYVAIEWAKISKRREKRDQKRNPKLASASKRNPGMSPNVKVHSRHAKYASAVNAARKRVRSGIAGTPRKLYVDFSNPDQEWVVWSHGSAKDPRAQEMFGDIYYRTLVEPPKKNPTTIAPRGKRNPRIAKTTPKKVSRSTKKNPGRLKALNKLTRV